MIHWVVNRLEGRVCTMVNGLGKVCSTIGRYHKLSADHVDSYLGEFCWRYNRRHLQPWMFQTLLREVATKPPVTYKKLTREIF
jgi:hypothetical protein